MAMGKVGKLVLIGAISYFAGSTLSKLTGKETGLMGYAVKIAGAGAGAYLASELLG